MPAQDHNETFDNITALNSITDPAGNTITGSIGGGGTGNADTTANENVTGHWSFDSWNVVDLVNAGADDTGATDITPTLNSLTVEANNTLVIVPPGDYLLGSAWTHNSFGRFAMIARDGATFHVAAGATTTNTPTWTLGEVTSPGRELYLENLTFDTSRDNAGMGVRCHATHQLEVDGMEVVGQNYHDTPCLQPGLTTTTGMGMVRNLRLPDGSEADWVGVGLEDAPTGVFVFPEHVGTLTFKDCHIANFPNNGLYASGATGTVIVDGGRYVNNNVQNIRVSDGGIVKNATIVQDAIPINYGTSTLHQRGIWAYDGTVRIHDCTFQMGTGSDTTAKGIVVAQAAEHVSIENCHFELNGSRWAVRAPAPNVGVEDRGLLIDGCSISGTADTTGTPEAISSDRPHTTVRDAHIQQPNRAGVDILGDHSEVTDSHIATASAGVTVAGVGSRVENSHVTTATGPPVTVHVAGDTVVVTDNWFSAALADNGTATIAYDNLTATGQTHDTVTNDRFPLENPDIAHSSLTVAGNLVNLGASTTIAHGDLVGIGSADHHSRFTTEEAQDAVGTILGDGLVYDDVNNIISQNVVASGSTTLTNSAATVVTGVTTPGTRIDVALDPSGNGQTVKCAARAMWDETAQEYKVEILEDGTSVGNPTIGYDIIAY